MTTLKTLQLTVGRSRDFVRQTPNDDGTFGGIYTGSETITYNVWPGDSEIPVLTQAGSPNAWVDAPSTIWVIGFSDAQTSTLTPGIYRLQVVAPLSGTRTGVLFEGLLEAVASGGTTVPSPSPLITDTYAAKLLAALGLTADQWEALPALILAASDAVRRECLGRDFTLQTYTEDCPVAYDGYARLAQIPVNQVLRVQSRPQTAVTIANTSSAVQIARVSFVLTGDVAIGQAVTGLMLIWASNGVASSQIIDLTTANLTITALATAVNAVGSGWTAQVDTILGARPVTELIGTPLTLGANGESSAELQVYSEDLANIRFHPDSGQRTGLVWIGRRTSIALTGRWGPGFDDLDQLDEVNQAVRITYSAGYITIPAIIQQATVEVLKAGLNRLASDDVLASEAAADYSYAFRDVMDFIPPAIRQALARWKINNA